MHALRRNAENLHALFPLAHALTYTRVIQAIPHPPLQTIMLPLPPFTIPHAPRTQPFHL
ncbi:hypothetical protein BDZ94DRAFT_1260129 [Collybia nuda]|uniref:Uncharacterized protein n=1 Tax=Collybia nuda TaxID=64659 RepID=A0A9P5Y632_9AGAR|nr:hypothetical protein BDZ94DRAFT_1260129 [Collybia nuda]